MHDFLYGIVGAIYSIHEYFLSLNDKLGLGLSDKMLHFFIIGIVGLLITFIVHPLFTWLAENGHTIVITFLYVFSAIIVITFAIEIGQRLTKTGDMEFADIVSGIGGFIVMFALFALIRALVTWIVRLVRRRKAARSA